MHPILLVDLGNVLVKFHPEPTLARLRSVSGLDEGKLKDALYGEAWVRLNMGDIEWPAFAQMVRQTLGDRISLDEIRDGWCAALSPIPETSDLLRLMVGRYPLYLLSNTDPMHFSFSRQLVPLLDSFSGFVLSYTIRRMKPDPGFFHQALSFIGAEPSQCVFIDDLAENVRSATALGLRSIRYQSASHLKQALSALGVRFPESDT